MRKKQRMKAALEQSRKKKRFEEKRKKSEAKKNSRSDYSHHPLLTFIGLFVLLLIGWYCFTNHLDEESTIGGIEPALAQPYYTWFKALSVIYWIVGLTSLIGVLVFERSNELVTHIFLTIIGLLASLGILSTCIIALIKLNAPALAFIYSGFIVCGLIIHSFLSTKKNVGRSFKFIGIYFMTAALLLLLSLFIADPTDGKYYLVVKGSTMGSISTKLYIWVISLGGLGFSTIILMLKLGEIEEYVKKKKLE